MTDNMPIEILPFEPKYQADIDEMLASIAEEFPVNIWSPVYRKMSELYVLPDRRYWAAIADAKAIGTVGMILWEDHTAVLKSMFLHKTYRHTTQKVATRLLKTAEQWAIEQKSENIYLGTMDQFKAAQRFYERNDYKRIDETQLPQHYPSNAMDTVFYKKDISRHNP